jgi:hypothetical protein
MSGRDPSRPESHGPDSQPRGPSRSDPFREGQEAAEEARRELEILREDVAAMVRDEVGRAGMPRSELERVVAEAVRREAEAQASTPVWQSVGLVAVGALIGVVVGAFGYGALFGGDEVPAASARGPEPAESSAVASQDPPAVQPQPPTPDETADRYDSLFAARDTLLSPLVATLESGSAAPVMEAVGAWRAGDTLTDPQGRRLHDALVQAALNALAGTTLSLDGLLTRNPCGGASCGALLELWRARGDELGMPPLPEEGTPSSDILAVAEKVLVMKWMEARGG